MNEKLKEFAAQAGFNLSGDYHCDECELERFAELVRADECERMKEEFKSECYLSEKEVEDVVNKWRKIVSEQDKTIQLMKTLEQTGKKFVRKKFTNLSDDDLSRISLDCHNISIKDKTDTIYNSDYVRHLALQIAIRLKELNT